MFRSSLRPIAELRFCQSRCEAMFQRREIPANRGFNRVLFPMVIHKIFDFLACIAVRQPTRHAAWIGTTPFVDGPINRDSFGFGLLESAQ